MWSGAPLGTSEAKDEYSEPSRCLESFLSRIQRTPWKNVFALTNQSAGMDVGWRAYSVSRRANECTIPVLYCSQTNAMRRRWLTRLLHSTPMRFSLAPYYVLRQLPVYALQTMQLFTKQRPYSRRPGTLSSRTLPPSPLSLSCPHQGSLATTKRDMRTLGGLWVPLRRGLSSRQEQRKAKPTFKLSFVCHPLTIVLYRGRETSKFLFRFRLSVYSLSLPAQASGTCTLALRTMRGGRTMPDPPLSIGP